MLDEQYPFHRIYELQVIDVLRNMKASNIYKLNCRLIKRAAVKKTYLQSPINFATLSLHPIFEHRPLRMDVVGEQTELGEVT
jgi:hypothetical protein